MSAITEVKQGLATPNLPRRWRDLLTKVLGLLEAGMTIPADLRDQCYRYMEYVNGQNKFGK